MKPVFWKVSMGPGSAGEDFKSVLEVLDWIRRGVVLVNKETKRMATSKESQGARFIEPGRLGDYFYLCHGNKEPGVLLLGQFTGPANIFSTRGDGWAERPFRWIRTSISPKRYKGEKKWWAPNFDSTFILVPEGELTLFE